MPTIYFLMVQRSLAHAHGHSHSDTHTYTKYAGEGERKGNVSGKVLVVGESRGSHVMPLNGELLIRLFRSFNNFWTETSEGWVHAIPPAQVSLRDLRKQPVTDICQPPDSLQQWAPQIRISEGAADVSVVMSLGLLVIKVEFF